MKFFGLYVFLFLSVTCAAVQLQGTMYGPDGAAVTGRLEFTLPKQTSDTCTAGVVVPVMAGVVKITNGQLDHAINIVRSDCLSPPQPYLVNMYVGSTFLATTRWWVGQSVQVSAIGNRWVHNAGVLAYPTGTQQAVYVMELGGYRTRSQSSGSFGVSESKAIAIAWPSAFTTLAYSVGCSVSDGTGLLHAISISGITKTSVVFTVINSSGSTTVSTSKVTCNAREN